MRQIIVIIASMFLLSACTEFSLKRSATNKIFDFSGPDGNKKRPANNRAYIDKAKYNVMGEDDDEDDDDEYRDESARYAGSNVRMYRDMAEHDAKRKAKMKKRKSSRYIMEDDDEYDDLPRAQKKLRQTDAKSKDEMQKELSEIKKMLTETKKDLTKYKCPLVTNNNGDAPHSVSDSIGVVAE